MSTVATNVEAEIARMSQNGAATSVHYKTKSKDIQAASQQPTLPMTAEPYIGSAYGASSKLSNKKSGLGVTTSINEIAKALSGDYEGAKAFLRESKNNQKLSNEFRNKYLPTVLTELAQGTAKDRAIAIRKFVERDHGNVFTGTVEAALKNDSMVMEAKVYALNDDGSFKKTKDGKKEKITIKDIINEGKLQHYLTKSKDLTFSKHVTNSLDSLGVSITQNAIEFNTKETSINTKAVVHTGTQGVIQGARLSKQGKQIHNTINAAKGLKHLTRIGRAATLFTPIGIAAFIGTELVFGAIDLATNDTPDTYVGKALSWTAGLFSSGSRA